MVGLVGSEGDGLRQGFGLISAIGLCKGGTRRPPGSLARLDRPSAVLEDNDWRTSAAGGSRGVRAGGWLGRGREGLVVAWLGPAGGGVVSGEVV